jgi:UDP-N-acetylmuramyl pentapeptide phosphotransferase/UDP-N-acetylglucosamine-1-phosphate transferase
MDRATIAISLFFLTSALSGLLVWKSIPIGHQLGILNRPSARGISTSTVPRIGGIPVLVAFLFGIAASFSFDVIRFPSEVERVALLCAGGTIVAVLMAADDAAGLSARSKLVIQLGIAALIVLPRLRGPLHGITIDQFNIPVMGQVSLPLTVAIPFTILWFVGMMNTLNWADGVDGLAGSITLVAASIMFLHTYFWPRGDPQFTISILPLVLAATMIGFLPFNWHPARIMLGDSGSNFLGFMLAGISIIGGAKLATALLVLGLPVLDVALVIAQRGINRKPIASGDMSHLHHRLIRRGWSESQVVLVVSCVSMGFGLLALVLPNREAKLMALAVLAGLLALSVRQLRTGACHSRPEQDQ